MTQAPEGYSPDHDGTLKRQHDVHGGPHDEPPGRAQFTLELTIGDTVLDYQDIAAVLRDVADELDEPNAGSPNIDGPARGKIYRGGIGVRDRTTIGQWHVGAPHARLDGLLELDRAGALDGIRAIIIERLKRVRAGLDRGYPPGGLTAAAEAEIRASWTRPPGGRPRAVPDLARITEAAALLAAQIDQASALPRPSAPGVVTPSSHDR